MFKVKEKATLSLFLIVLLLGFPQLSETIYTPSLPDLAHALQVNEKWAEFTLSIYFIGFALGVCLWGVVSDYIGRRPALLAGLSIYCVGSWGCYKSSSIALLLGWRFIQACGASAGSVVTQTMIRDLYTGAKRNQIFSVVGGALALSPAVGPLIGGGVDQLAGWRGNFVVLVGMGLALLSYCFWVLPETKEGERKGGMPFKRVAGQFLTDGKIWAYAILIGACNGIIFSYYAEAPFIFIECLGFTPGQYGLFGMVLALGSIGASVLSHRLNRQEMSGEKIIRLGCYCAMLASIGLTGWAYLGLLQEVNFVRLGAILVLICLLFFGIGLIIPNALSQALTDYRETMGTAGALFGLAYYFLIAGLTFLMGYLHNGNVEPMPLYFLFLAAVMTATSYGLKKRRRRDIQTA
ncbi:multidrug effflux MFS transporter [Candidatus Protochlamydia phocaeensis]|uniref:multidrug effflux MFS transporter n=1 Tax=Candidatus Protochlamydia phocaeensis TaxID=1414722 RepID=UPI000839163B|nr:multidrug effflux MFS transporter [Candidatus Protochlamydia phocaeensis]